MQLWSSGQGAGFLVQWFQVQNHCKDSKWTLPFFYLSVRKSWGLKSCRQKNLYHCSDSIALRQLNPIHKRDHEVFLFMFTNNKMYLHILNGSSIFCIQVSYFIFLLDTDTIMLLTQNFFLFGDINIHPSINTKSVVYIYDIKCIYSI